MGHAAWESVLRASGAVALKLRRYGPDPRVTTIVPAALIMIISTGPWIPEMPTAELDPSWRTMLHEAYLRHYIFGRDIQFTFGPFGFAYTELFHPATFPQLVTIRALITIGVVCGIAALSIKPTRQFLVGSTMALAIVFAGSPLDSLFAFVPMLGSLLSIVERSRFEKAIAVCLAVLSGLIALSKFTFFAYAFLAYGIADIARFIDRRNLPIYFPLWVISVLVFWIVAGQPIDSFGAFLFSSTHTASSYSESMQINGRPVVAALFLCLCTMMGFYAWRRGRGQFVNPQVIGSGLIILLFLFVSWKEGFIRLDLHAIVGFNAAFVAALTLIVLADRFFPRLTAPRLGLACILVTFVASVGVTNHYLGGNFGPLRPVSWIFSNAASFVSFLGPGRGIRRLNQEHQRATLKIREDVPLDIKGKSVDIMSYRSTIPFALNLDYRPRPSFQSYGTWNGFLAKANNKFLMSTRGPELMLLEISPIDSRLATEEDPDVFLTLLQRFEVRDAQAGLLVLQRKGQFQPAAGRALGSQMVRFGEWIDLPSTTARDLLWIQADIKPTLLGWLVGISWRFPVLGLDLQYPDGHLAHFRLIPELLRNGFIISPTVTNIKEYVAASNGSSDVAQARPTQIRCTGNRFVNLVYNENTAFGLTAYAIGGTSNFP